MKPLADVTEAISIKLKSEKSLALVEQKVKELAEKINAGETTLAEVAAELATDVVEAVDVTRVGSKQPFNLVKNVFTLKFDAQNPKATYVESAANAFAIVELKSVVAADVSAISDSEKDNIASQIERTTANSELINVTADLRNNASIKINEKVFEDSNQ
ncbi:hypothetical protein MNBD_GAMMA01-498 [hydrothermal vent metagenome]|uniref:Peptidylprolyl isomerase n=1 Tax=hydrothermal vent metagenome TaxID=652676 RepID=A0A3B0UZY4_9ZZZZ